MDLRAAVRVVMIVAATTVVSVGAAQSGHHDTPTVVTDVVQVAAPQGRSLT